MHNQGEGQCVALFRIKWRSHLWRQAATTADPGLVVAVTELVLDFDILVVEMELYEAVIDAVSHTSMSPLRFDSLALGGKNQ